MKKGYYIDTEGFDLEAVKAAILFACDFASKNADVNRVILCAPSKNSMIRFNKVLGERYVQSLSLKEQSIGESFIMKIETIRTYIRTNSVNSFDIVVCCGIDDKDLFKIEEHPSVNYMISIPKVWEHSEQWIHSSQAEEISGKLQEVSRTFTIPREK